MKIRCGMTVAALLIVVIHASHAWSSVVPAIEARASAGASIELPVPRATGSMSVEEAIMQRRSIRRYGADHLTLAQLGQLVWAAQGITDARGLRTAPSAGGLYPLEIVVVAGRVAGLSAGVYRYVPHMHRLILVRSGDVRDALAANCLSQPWVRDGAVSIVFAAMPAQMASVYAAHADRYIDMEIGHASQNVYLQATSMKLGTVAVGACDNAAVGRLLGVKDGEDVRYLMPVGVIR